MNAPASGLSISNALVHQSALTTPDTRSRHAGFITRRLTVTFGALAVAPFFLAFRGAPTLAQALVFAWSFAPLAAAVLVARTGRLTAGHGVAAFGLLGFGVTLWGALDFGLGCAVACFAVGLLEAVQSGDRRLIGWTAIASTLCLAVVAIVSLRATGSSQPLAFELVAGLAFVYAVIVSIDPVASPRVTQQTGDAAFWAASSEIMDEFMVGFDASGSVVRAPDGGKTLAGTRGTELCGRGLFELVHVADRPAFLKLVADAAHGDDTTPIRLRLRTAHLPDSEPARPRHAWFEMKAKRVTGRSDDKDLAVVAALSDIDAVTALDAEIANAQSSIDEAIRSKDHFLANMSHELRTPLNAIIGFSEMLASHTLRPVESDKQREYARIIHQSGQHLLAVVNSILDMSKIRSGTFAIVPEPFDVVPLLDLSCDMIALKAEEGGVALVRDYSADLEQLVGDKRACKQVLINLLSNAVKFTPQGGQVTLSARPEGNTIVIAINDTGIGVAAEDLARLGDPFFQARSSRNRPFEGTGLGLSVVRGLVGLHGGTIELESELGRGTEVKVRLPVDCRAGTQTSPSAKIETLARRNSRENLAHFDQRMKQIA